jgi:ubiquinone/menaquinone biosynthesis C-methylase UbiE
MDARSIDTIPWDEIYQRGEHLTNWDRDDVSPELRAFVDRGGFAPGATAVDIGCGTGADACWLAAQGFSTVGLDVSAVALEAAAARSRELGVAVEWLRGDACELPFADQAIDLVADGSCAHHFTRSEWTAFAAEVARVLRPGGTLFLRGVSDRHRPTNCLSESLVAEHFDDARFRTREVTAFTITGGTSSAPGLLAVIERR